MLFPDWLAKDGRLTHCAASSVIAVHEGRLHVLGQGGVQMIGYDRLILTTGASDRVAPVPGWQSAGVYSLGAAQIALKAQGVALGRRIVLIGSGPLLTLVGAQLVKRLELMWQRCWTPLPGISRCGGSGACRPAARRAARSGPAG